MASNLRLDNDLIVEAMRLGNHKTKREAVTAALQNYLRLTKLWSSNDSAAKPKKNRILKKEHP